jgi:hypothetical protein
MLIDFRFTKSISKQLSEDNKTIIITETMVKGCIENDLYYPLISETEIKRHYFDSSSAKIIFLIRSDSSCFAKQIAINNYLSKTYV